MPPDSERLLIPQWAPELVVLSYAISWLGAYTSTQIVIHAKYTRNPWAKWLWTLLASLAFGFCAIWSMHFGEPHLPAPLCTSSFSPFGARATA
ncbi:hypothetical protein C8Q72DRAFT_374624 [Fomitopsis betulina]|nr:hypothetical protein C8Q72DRAFT_374624 [Fomitopsis betulina]